jgi:carbonic anhydrase
MNPPTSAIAASTRAASRAEATVTVAPVPSRRRFLTGALRGTLGAGLGLGVLSACAEDEPGASASGPNSQTTVAPEVPPAVANGDEALQRLLEGNQRFAADRSSDMNEGSERRVAVSTGQHPFATVLSCVDSRVPVELVFDQGLGDLVVVRSAGQVLDRSVTASIEFGVAELGTPLLMVLGHQRCGAVDATIKALDSPQTEAEGEIGYLVDALTPAVRQVDGSPGDRLDNAVHANVELVLAQLRQSHVLEPLESAGTLKMVGAYYELDSGTVTVG